MTRERTVDGETTVEVAYGMTSLGPERADAARLGEIVRGHWQMENGLHWVRDRTLQEDRCRVRKGTAPEVLAALRNAVVHLLSGHESVAEGLSRAGVTRRLGARPTQALQVLGLPPLD